MAQHDPDHADFTKTMVFGDPSELFRYIDNAVHTAPAPAPATVPQTPPSHEPIVHLAGKPTKGLIQHWWLVEEDLTTCVLAPDAISGAIVRTKKGKTSPILLFDPRSRRILTASGSVYELGMPESVFAAKARLVLRRLGF